MFARLHISLSLSFSLSLSLSLSIYIYIYIYIFIWSQHVPRVNLSILPHFLCLATLGVAGRGGPELLHISSAFAAAQVEA